MRPVKTSPQANLGCGFLAILICFGLAALLIGGGIFLDEHEKAADYQPIPTITATATDPSPNAPVTCNNVPMSPTALCDHLLGGLKTGTYTYDEQKDYQKQQRIENAQYDMNQKIALKYADIQNQQYEKYQNSFAHDAVGWFILIGGLLGLVGFAFVNITAKEAAAARRRRGQL